MLVCAHFVSNYLYFNQVTATIELIDGISRTMEWALAYTIVPAESSFKVLSTKVN